MLNQSNSKVAKILILLIAIGLVLVYVLKNNSKPVNPAPTLSVNPTSQPSTTPQALQPVIQGWKVYQNKEYGFRIDYPSDWKVDENGDFSSPKFNGYFPIIINIDKNSSNLSLRDWVGKESHINLGNVSKDFLESKGFLSDYYIDESTLDGVKALKVTNLSEAYFYLMAYKDKKEAEKYLRECGCEFDIDRIFVQKGDTVIHIFGSYDMHGVDTQNKLVAKNGRYEVISPDPLYNESKEIFAKMISSFRFIK